MSAPPLPAEVEKLRRDLLVDQAPSARSRTEVFRPGRFVQRYGRPYSSRRLPIATLDEMRTDALLRFAQLISLVPIFTGKWKIESTSARKAQFIDSALRQIIGRLLLQFFESWNFGFQALVKEFGLTNPDWQFLDKDADGGPRMAPVWDGGPEVPALIWQPFVPLSPRAVAPVWTAGGAFNGIALAQNGVGYGLPMVPFAQDDLIDVLPELMASFSNPDDDQRKKIDVDHALWVTSERDANWGSIWGRSRLGPAFKYWWSYEMTLGILNRSVERKGDPTIVVSYPQGRSMVNGQEVDNQTIAMQIGESARSGAVLSVPSEVWGEDMATANQASKWKIDYLKAEERFDELRAVLDYLDTMKIRSMMISELSAFEGSGGTSSRNVASVTGERSYEAQIFTQVEWDEIINAYMIPQLANQNFPELADVPARKITQTFGEGESALAADLLRSIANATPGQLPVDLPALLDRFQIDALTGVDMEKWAARMAAAAEQTPPPAAPAQAGGNAGVTDTGFYYDAPDLIQLEDEALLASLPKTKHYTDRAVLAQTRLVRKLFHALLSAQYEDFAAHIATAVHLTALGLDSGDEADKKRAERIVAGWRYTGGLAARTVKAVAVALGRIFARAGAVELSSSRIDSSKWNPLDATLADWVRDNVASMVKDVESTTRKQLRTYLANALKSSLSAEEIAQGVRSHFADFPDWRADLIARCLPPDAVVDAAVVRAATRRWYEGDMITVVTESGREFTATPNHPMLSGRGWISLGELQEGDYLVRDTRQEHASAAGDEDIEHQPARIDELFEAAERAGVIDRRRGSDDDFHGDGIEGDVDIARPDGLLRVGSFSSLEQPSAEQFLAESDEARAAFCLGCGTLLGDDALGFCGRAECGAFFSHDASYGHRGDAEIGSDRSRGTVALVGVDDGSSVDAVQLTGVSRADESTTGGLAQISRGDAASMQLPADRRCVDANATTDLMSAEAGQIEGDRIIERRLRRFSGHVYNLCTPYGYFTSQGFFTGNTETQRFYNAATLFAAEAAGSAQVQAIDAQRGPTDAECHRRNGRLFSISDAWHEGASEHIRGTLEWRILPPNVQLSLQYIDQSDAQGVAARVDGDERVIYLVEGLDLATEGQYLDQAVSWFIATA